MAARAGRGPRVVGTGALADSASVLTAPRGRQPLYEEWGDATLVEAEDLMVPESWRESAVRTLLVAGLAGLLATVFVLAVQLLR